MKVGLWRGIGLLEYIGLPRIVCSERGTCPERQLRVSINCVYVQNEDGLDTKTSQLFVHTSNGGLLRILTLCGATALAGFEE